MNLTAKVVLLLCCSLCAVERSAQAGGTDVETLPVRILFQENLCGGSGPDPAVVLVSDSGHLERIVSAAKRHTVGKPPKAPTVDFAAVNVVLIRMGQRPTGGYGIELAEPQARLDSGSALIRLRWNEPAPGTVSTQALTSPCLVIELPKGAYRKIVITDDSGKVKGEIFVRGTRD